VTHGTLARVTLGLWLAALGLGTTTVHGTIDLWLA
jgi:hypothetical protein